MFCSDIPTFDAKSLERIFRFASITSSRTIIFIRYSLFMLVENSRLDRNFLSRLHREVQY